MVSVRAELLLIRRRASTWLLLAVAVAMGVFFTYILPYAEYLNTAVGRRRAADLAKLLPGALVSTTVATFPFYFGAFALILGVLLFGSEYGWGTLRTALMQQPNRLRLFAAKLAALWVVLVVYTLTIFCAMALCSLVIAEREGAAADWPGVLDIVRALGAGWLLLAVWAMLGVLLGVLWCGTALAIGFGILYGFVVEGLVSGFGTSIRLLWDVAHAFLRTNGYSLVAGLSGKAASVGGPGAFSGPFVGAWQALGVLTLYLLAFAGITALVLQRRDVT
ncbi:MAG TPA: ABC transporter permease [Dehalococcoidia bacterium]|jgi:ABC-2 type transport system permease protein|nr:ABC transporter permease [Dehalococcoidia bacterium]